MNNASLYTFMNNIYSVFLAIEEFLNYNFDRFGSGHMCTTYLSTAIYLEVNNFIFF